MSPYPGLRPFEAHEAAIFFGREDHVGRLLEILDRERFLVVIGPSGSGKSSLVRAGMLPALTAGLSVGGGDWRIGVMRPGDHPMRSLARVLLDERVLRTELVGEAVTDRSPSDVMVSMTEAELWRGPRGFKDLIASVRRRHADVAQPFDLLIVVDQFEEIFRYASENERHADEADAFVRTLLDARSDGDGHIYVALTMRSEFLGACTRFQDLPDSINRAQYLTPRLTRTELQSAIASPARVLGGSIAPELVADLVNAVGSDSDQLPILQHALARMWAKTATPAGTTIVTREAASAIGGITGALNRHADELFLELSPEQQEVAELMFRAITAVDASSAGASDIRRPQQLGDVAVATGLEWRSFEPVVNHFAREGVNFLTFVGPLGVDTVIDISHEALIRQWRRLREWVADERERARTYHRLRLRCEGDLLTGTDLARAIEWLGGRGGAPAGTRTWTPTAAWAVRYSGSSAGDAQVGFAEVAAYIERSEAAHQEGLTRRHEAEQREREREQRRLEAEKRAVEATLAAERARAEAETARAEAAVREQQLAKATVRKLRVQGAIATAVATLAVLTSIVAGYYYLRARKAEAHAADAQKVAEDQSKKAEAQRLVAEDRRIFAEEQRGIAERAAREAEAANTEAAAARSQVELLRQQLEARDYRSEQATSAAPPPPPPTGTTTTPGPQKGRLLDAGAFAAFVPQLPSAQRAEILPPLLSAMREFDVTTPLRQAAFLTQINFESAGFRVFEERFQYTAATLRRLYSRYFKNDEEAQEFAGKPERVANRIYANRLGNGPEESGDGWRYRGRSPLQIVGRSNYAAYGKLLGLNLEEQPDQASTYAVGFRIAGAFWQRQSINPLADQGNLRDITRRLTGGVGGLTERQSLYEKAKSALMID